MNNKLLRPASDVYKEIMESLMKDLKWHQKLRLKTQMKLDDIWTWILINIIYRKYKS